MKLVKFLSVVFFIITSFPCFTADKANLTPITGFNKAFITNNNASPFSLKKYSNSSSNDLLFRKNVAICLITSGVAISVASTLGVALSIPFFFYMGFLVPLAIIAPSILALPVGIILGYYGGLVYKEIYDIEKGIASKSPDNDGAIPDITLAAFSL